MVSAGPMRDGGAAGGSRSFSREPGISLALLQGTWSPERGHKRRSPAWAGGCAHSGVTAQFVP